MKRKKKSTVVVTVELPCEPSKIPGLADALREAIEERGKAQERGVRKVVRLVKKHHGTVTFSGR